MLMDTLERATVYTTVDLIDHVAGRHETARIISKTTGSVSIVAVDAGVDMGSKISPFDTLMYILEGSADVTIDRQGHHLTAGQCIILPAHFDSRIISKRKFKMLLTVIKSGYET
jgi:mannose-6-phosphate isomerase-like protein (cupin superfamily)